MNINDIQSKEDALELLDKAADKFGITFNEIKEKYNSRKIQGGGLRVKRKV